MITTTLEAALVLLSIEVGLLAVANTFFAYRGTRSVEAESAAEATELVSKVTSTEDVRRVALETVIRDKYQYEGDELSATVDEFMQREKAFYNAVVGAFLGRGDHKISDLNDELTKVVAPWISITPNNMVAVQEADSLAAEKAEVEAELSETKKVLEKMIAEYNSAFSTVPSSRSSEDSPEGVPSEAKDSDDTLLSISLDDDNEVDKNDTAQLEDQASTEKQPAGEETANSVSIDLKDEGDGETENVLATLELAEEEKPSSSEDDDVIGEADSVAIGQDEEFSGEQGTETSNDGADQLMTAEDLDNLMQGLEPDPKAEVEKA